MSRGPPEYAALRAPGLLGLGFRGQAVVSTTWHNPVAYEHTLQRGVGFGQHWAAARSLEKTQHCFGRCYHVPQFLAAGLHVSKCAHSFHATAWFQLPLPEDIEGVSSWLLFGRNLSVSQG